MCESVCAGGGVNILCSYCYYTRRKIYSKSCIFIIHKRCMCTGCIFILLPFFEGERSKNRTIKCEPHLTTSRALDWEPGPHFLIREGCRAAREKGVDLVEVTNGVNVAGEKSKASNSKTGGKAISGSILFFKYRNTSGLRQIFYSVSQAFGTRCAFYCFQCPRLKWSQTVSRCR